MIGHLLIFNEVNDLNLPGRIMAGVVNRIVQYRLLLFIQCFHVLSSLPPGLCWHRRGCNTSVCVSVHAMPERISRRPGRWLFVCSSSSAVSGSCDSRQSGSGRSRTPSGGHGDFVQQVLRIPGRNSRQSRPGIHVHIGYHSRCWYPLATSFLPAELSCPVEIPRFHTKNLKKVRNFYELRSSFITALQPAFRRKLQACHFAKRPVFSGALRLFPCSTGHICYAVHVPSECSRTPAPAISRILTREGAAVF